MDLFAGFRKDSWRHQISRVVANRRPIGTQHLPNEAFPWTALQQITNKYLAKTKSLKTTLQRDNHLDTLMQEYPAKDIAVAACGHALSLGSLRVLLAWITRLSPQNNTSLTSSIEIILIANRVNPNAVGSLDVEVAMRLLAFENTPVDAHGQRLEGLSKIMAVVSPMNNILLYPCVPSLAFQESSLFSTDLETFCNKSMWLEARRATAWLQNLGCVPMEELLHAKVHNWRAWTCWNPTSERIIKWGKIGLEEKKALRSLLALEGPDFFQSKYETFCEALLHLSCNVDSESRVGWLGGIFKEEETGTLDELRGMVNHVLEFVDGLCTEDMNPELRSRLLKYLSRLIRISHKDLDILECLASLSDNAISELLLVVLEDRDLDPQDFVGKAFDQSTVKYSNKGITNRKSKEPQEESRMLTSIMKLLPMLSWRRCQRLRGVAGFEIANAIAKTILEIQSSSSGSSSWEIEQAHVKMGRGGMAGLLQEFRKEVVRTTWLLPLLPMDVLDLVKDWKGAEENPPPYIL